MSWKEYFCFFVIVLLTVLFWSGCMFFLERAAEENKVVKVKIGGVLLVGEFKKQ